MSGPFIPSDKEPVGTPAWRRFFQSLADRRPLAGTAGFAGTDRAAVALVPPMPDADYVVVLEPPENQTFWVEDKTPAGFAVRAATATTATISYSLSRG